MLFNAIQKMEVGPPEAAYRSSLQTTLRCFKDNVEVLIGQGKGIRKVSGKSKRDERKCSIDEVFEKDSYSQNYYDLRCNRNSIAVTCLLAIWQSSLKWHDFYSGFCMELGNLSIDASLFVNLPPAEWGKDKGKQTEYRCYVQGRTNP